MLLHAGGDAKGPPGKTAGPPRFRADAPGGIPVVGDELFGGNDRLEDALEAASR